MVKRRTWGQYSSLSPSLNHLSHTTNITLSRIKFERYIFIKKCIRSFIEVRILYLITSPLIFVLRPYNTNPRGVVANVSDCDIFVNEFKFQSCYYVHFWNNAFRKGMNPLIPAVPVNSTITLILNKIGIKKLIN